MHIGSGSDMEHLGQVCGAMEKAAREVGPSLTSISAGGGLPIDYHEGKELADTGAYFTLWNKTRERLAAAFGHPLSLEIEPGRYLVAESGYLITEIRAVKTRWARTRSTLSTPASTTSPARSSTAPTTRWRSAPPKASRGVPAPESLRNVVVGGPLCESGDIFTQGEGGYVDHRALPDANIGDYLVIGYAGAYGYVMANNYNSKPLVAEVLIENGKTNLVRARQTLDDLTRGEVIPK